MFDAPPRRPTMLTGILAWAMRRCLKWQEEGLFDAPEVGAATRAHRAGNDQLTRFLADDRVDLPPVVVPLRE